jgi:uncharacterized protein YwqG
LANRDEWQLLFQIDGDETAGIVWGDAGRLYCMIRRDDLERRDWAACWFSLQSV